MKAIVLLLIQFVISQGRLPVTPADSLQGLVVTLDGAPIPNAKVTATPDGASPPGWLAIVTRSDKNGAYRIESLAPGNYVVTAEIDGQKGTSIRAVLGGATSFFDDFVVVVRQGNSTSIISADGTATRAARTSISPQLVGPAQVTIPGPPENVDLVILPSAVNVSGHLPNLPHRSMASSVRVTLSGPNLSMTENIDVQSNGSFTFRGVPPGTYTLRLEPNMGVPPLDIHVANRNIPDIEFGKRAYGVRVAGHLPPLDRLSPSGQPVQWVYLVGQDAVAVQNSEGMKGLLISSIVDLIKSPAAPQLLATNESNEQVEVPISPVGADREFEFLTIPPGVYVLRTFHDSGFANTPVVVRNSDLSGIEAGVGFRVRGEVVPTNFGTRPPALIRLIAVAPNGPTVSAVINENGAFEFPYVGPGQYRVVIDSKFQPRPSLVTVDANDTIIRVEAPFSSWIRGRVMFTGANPPPEAVAAIHVAMTNGCVSTVNADGSFRLPSNDGEYDFSASDLPEGYVIKSVTYGTDNLMDSPIKVDASVSAREILLTVEYRPGVPR
jgi:Carboxypeptidase regulatory-like domain